MDGEKIFKIVLMELTTDNLKLEAELEQIINSDVEINHKTQTIKSILSRMVMIDASINKFSSMVTNNNEKIQTNNGNDNM